MKIILFVVCLIVLHRVEKNVSAAGEITNIDDKFVYEFELSSKLLKSERCKSDLNYTFASYRDNEDWAIASA